MEFRNFKIRQVVCVGILFRFLDSFVIMNGHRNTGIIKYRSYKGTILSNCGYVSSDVTSAIECGRLFSESSNVTAFVYDQGGMCRICDIVEDIDFNATGQFFMRHPSVLYPRQNESIWIPGGLRAGQLIEVKTKPLFDKSMDGICIVFRTGTADKIGQKIPLAFQVHLGFTHVHGFIFINDSLKLSILNLTKIKLDFDQEFTTRFLVTSKAFKVSIDGQYYFMYDHLITALETIQYICLNCITYNYCQYGILRDTELRLPDSY